MSTRQQGSNNLRRRYHLHCRPSAASNQAAFAFLLARERTGRAVATYLPGENSRAGLMRDPEFAAEFRAAKSRIRAMEFRFVGEADQKRQALLDIYCATVLETPYNEFRTH